VKEKKLINRIEVPIRFSEVDSMKIVWHGNYVKYLEDGREAFGKQFGIGYLDIYAKGYKVPLVKIECNYKKFVKYGDTLIVETEFIDTLAAKIIYQFRLYNKNTNELVADGESIQVFLDENNELILTVPEFFENWKSEYGLI
jgi:acyl-CoA thioester hydrolase